MQAIREWEHHSQGATTFLFQGVDVPRPPLACDPGDIMIKWDVINGGANCGWTNGSAGSCWEILLDGRPGSPNPLDPQWVPVANTACTDFQSTIIHELAHMARNTFSHASNSVLQGPVFGKDLVSRHLWNGDMNPSPIWSRHWFRNWIEDYNMSTFETTLNSEEGFTFATANIGVGDPLAEYSWAYGDNSGVFFRRGSYGSAVSISNFYWNSGISTEFAAYHRVCVTSNGFGRYLLAWPSINETPPAFDFFGNLIAPSGSRNVIFMTSADFGNTWSAPAAVPGATTRTGISCSFDRIANRWVLLFNGALDERLRVVQRTPTSTSWSSPVVLSHASVTPRSMDAPSIAFDTTSSGNGTGWIAWVDLLQGPRVMQVVFNAGSGTYQIPATSPSLKPTLNSVDDASLKSRLALLVINNLPHIGYTVQGGMTYGQVRARFDSSFNRAETWHPENASSVIVTYNGAARGAISPPRALFIRSRLW